MLIILAIVFVVIIAGIVVYFTNTKGKEPKNEQKYNGR